MTEQMYFLAQMKPNWTTAGSPNPPEIQSPQILGSIDHTEFCKIVETNLPPEPTNATKTNLQIMVSNCFSKTLLLSFGLLLEPFLAPTSLILSPNTQATSQQQICKKHIYQSTPAIKLRFHAKWRGLWSANSVHFWATRNTLKKHVFPKGMPKRTPIVSQTLSKFNKSDVQKPSLILGGIGHIFGFPMYRSQKRSVTPAVCLKEIWWCGGVGERWHAAWRRRYVYIYIYIYIYIQNKRKSQIASHVIECNI